MAPNTVVKPESTTQSTQQSQPSQSKLQATAGMSAPGQATAGNLGGKVATSPVGRPSTTAAASPAVPTMAQQVNRIAGVTLAPNILAKLARQKFNTGDVSAQWFHCVLYGETDARKSTTAARFGTPENTRIVLLRRKEQLIPLRALKYNAFLAEDWGQASMALQYPEAIWPEWAKLPDRTLVLDDITEGKEMAAEDNSTNDKGEEVRDIRKITRGAKEDIRPVIKSVLRKPMHFIVVSMARQWDQSDTEGRIMPDLPQSIANLITTDFEFVFYVRKGLWQLVTHETRIQSTRKDEHGKKQSYVQTIFAKHKVPQELEGKGVIKPSEPLDLRAIWERVKAAAASPEKLKEILSNGETSMEVEAPAAESETGESAASLAANSESQG